MNKRAFTLAEVLITLGIIGIVSAITLPSVIQNQQKKSLEVATKKFYTTMSQAVRQYMADEGVDDLRNTPLAANGDIEESEDAAEEEVSRFMHTYFNVIKECKDGDYSCWVDKYSTFNGENETVLIYTFSNTTYVLSDGMVVYFYPPDDWGRGAWPGDIYVDVNGKKKGLIE